METAFLSGPQILNARRSMIHISGLGFNPLSALATRESRELQLLGMVSGALTCQPLKCISYFTGMTHAMLNVNK